MYAGNLEVSGEVTGGISDAIIHENDGEDKHSS